MPRTSLLKIILLIGIGAILAVIVAAPLVGAQGTNKKDSGDKQKQSSQQTSTDAQTEDPNPLADSSAPDTSDSSGVHWAAIATDNGTPTVKHASDSSTTVAPSEGKPGEYTLTFPTEVHVLACTATINSGAAGTIYCGAGEDTGLNANQLKVLTTDANSSPAQGSGFTVAAYSSAASSEQGSSSGQSATKEATAQKNKNQKNK
jgi:hypothetical protein